MIWGYMLSSTQDSRKVAKQLKDANCEHIRRDSHINGIGRSERGRMINALEKGDELVVARVTDLADSTLDLLEVLREVSEKKAKVHSLAEPWVDLHQRSLCLLTVLEGLTAFERDVRRARTLRGQASALNRGIKLGRKPKLTSKQVEDAKRRRRRGETQASIAESYNVSNSMISRLTP